jgi:hypothetical protein
LFSNALAERGHDVTVVTAPQSNVSGEDMTSLTVENITIEVYSNPIIEVHVALSRLVPGYFRAVSKVLRFIKFTLLQHIDFSESWAKSSSSKVTRLLRKGQFDAVIVSGHPCSLNYWGARLSSEFPETPFVQDFRDLWNSEVNYSKERLGIRKRRSVSMESYVLKTTPIILNVSRGQSEIMRSCSDKLSSADFRVLSNGFERMEIKSSIQTKSDLIRVVHAGSIRWNAEKALSNLFEAIVNLEVRQGVLPVRFDLYGLNVDLSNLGHYSADLIDRYVYFHDFVEQDELQKIMVDSDYGLIIFDKPTGLGTKTFDYLSVGLPIFAIAPEGELASFCERSGFPVADYSSEKIEALLLHILKKGAAKPNSSHQEFEISTLTSELESILKSAIGSHYAKK